MDSVFAGTLLIPKCQSGSSQRPIRQIGQKCRSGASLDYHPSVYTIGPTVSWHRLVVGTPEQLADTIAEWFLAGAVDGFNLMPDFEPSGIEVFVEHVVPILRRRGLFRREYQGTTLRDHLGWSRPEKLSAAA
jgi:hypothetical protein